MTKNQTRQATLDAFISQHPRMKYKRLVIEFWAAVQDATGYLAPWGEYTSAEWRMAYDAIREGGRS